MSLFDLVPRPKVLEVEMVKVLVRVARQFDADPATRVEAARLVLEHTQQSGAESESAGR